MAKLSKKESEQQLLAKNRYWQNELDSLGIEPKRKTELNDDKEELEDLADIIKQTMFQDYKVEYGEKAMLIKKKQSQWLLLDEVVDSNPTLFIFIDLDNYCIELIIQIELV
jgi:hypothetical protein